MMKKFNFSYDEDVDILMVHYADEIIKYSKDSHTPYLIIIDFNSKNKPVGVEMLGASKVIYGMNKTIMKNIEHAEFKYQIRGDILNILLILKAKNMEPIRTSIPITINS